MFRNSPSICQQIHLSPLTHSINIPRNIMKNISHPPAPFPHPPLVFATQPVHPMHQTQSWVDMIPQGQAIIFFMDIHMVETLVILQNQNFMAQLISEGMKIAMEYFVNQINVGNKCTRPPSTSNRSCLHPNNADNVEPPRPSQSIPKHEQPSTNPFLHSGRANSQQPTTFSLATSLNSSPPILDTNPGSQFMQVPQDLEEESAPPLRKISSFTKISNFKSSALMIFPKEEDKKHIHNCPLNLTKFSFNLMAAIKNALTKYTVVMTPTMRTHLNPTSGNTEILPLFFSPMSHPVELTFFQLAKCYNTPPEAAAEFLKADQQGVLVMRRKRGERVCFVVFRLISVVSDDCGSGFGGSLLVDLGLLLVNLVAGNGKGVSIGGMVVGGGCSIF
ncbi:hypothetical protein KY290_036567 [Solanum tuberosum]|uniref:Uncharacterized protein n=1 Tax=Solanum tuberosum TaxID=4113 RepID=A0ABQ7TT21_SOLTU|nr:hypothetical protein KY290_036567 [Solanum tuberosum]